MIVTDEMVLAAARTLIRYTLAERDKVKPEAVTEEEIDDELAEIRQLEAESPEWPGVDEVFAEVLTAALDVSGGAVTREPSDIWQAVLVINEGRVIEPEALFNGEDDWSVCIVRRSAAPIGDPRVMPDGDEEPEPDDIAHCWQDFESDSDVAERYRMAQRMAAGLNAAEVTT